MSFSTMVLHSQRSLSPLRRRHRPPALINPIVLTAFTAGFAVALVFSTYATMIGHLESGRRGSTMYADELPDHSRSAQLFNWHWGRRKRILAFVGVQVSPSNEALRSIINFQPKSHRAYPYTSHQTNYQRRCSFFCSCTKIPTDGLHNIRQSKIRLHSSAKRPTVHLVPFINKRTQHIRIQRKYSHSLHNRT